MGYDWVNFELRVSIMFKFLLSTLLFLPLLATANPSHGKYEQSEESDGTLEYLYNTVADDVIHFIASTKYNPKKQSGFDLHFYVSFDERKVPIHELWKNQMGG